MRGPASIYPLIPADGGRAERNFNGPAANMPTAARARPRVPKGTPSGPQVAPATRPAATFSLTHRMSSEAPGAGDEGVFIITSDLWGYSGMFGSRRMSTRTPPCLQQAREEAEVKHAGELLLETPRNF